MIERLRAFRFGIVSLLLSVTGVVAGEAVVAPICYWRGRASLGSHPAFTPMAWSESARGAHVIAFAIGLTWLVLWVLNSVWVYRARQNALYVIVPALPFTWSGAQGLMYAYACNIF